MGSKTKLLLVLITLTATAALLNWLIGTQIRDWRQAKLMAQQHPYLALVPQPLPELGSSAAPGTTLSDFGYEYEVAWPAPTTSRRTNGVAAYIFPGERGLAFFDPAESTAGFDHLPSPIQQLISALTGYEVMKRSLYTTPDQVSLFLSKRESARRMFLLNQKDIDLRRSPSVVYSFERSQFRGFQMGNPSTDDQVEVLCFDRSGRQLVFEFGSTSSSRPRVSQQDVSRMIETILPAKPITNREAAPQ